MVRFCSTIVFVMIATCAAAGQYGEFVGHPQGQFMDGPDRPLFKLTEPFVYKDPNGLEWVTPAGEIVDGASIPDPAWSILGGPFSGKYLDAAVIHDYYCCAKTREYYSTHHAFWLGMRASGVGRVKADIMWAAVRFMGPDIWSVDPEAAPPVPCNGEPTLAGNIYDSASPDVQSKAVAKLTAMARTLTTTDGTVLDVVQDRVIETETPEAEQHLSFLHEALLKNFDVSASQVGLISGVTATELEQANLRQRPLAPWVQGQIPALDRFMKASGITYPQPATLNGSAYAPFVANDLSQFDVQEFPIAPLQNRLDQLRKK